MFGKLVFQCSGKTYTSVDKSEKQCKWPRLNLPVVMSKIIAEDKNMTAKGILLPKKCKVIMQTM